MRHTAIRNLYPNAVNIWGDNIAFDAAGETIALDESKVTAEFSRLQAEYAAKEYQRLRAAAYPDYRDYLDGIVKSDAAQVQKYIADCLAVKARFPK